MINLIFVEINKEDAVIYSTMLILLDNTHYKKEELRAKNNYLKNYKKVI